MKTKDVVSVMPHLAYYKTGDDFMGFLKRADGDVSKAYLDWADSLAESVKDLRRIGEILKGQKADADGGANCLFLFVTEDVSRRLIEADLAQLDPCQGDEEVDEEGVDD